MSQNALLNIASITVGVAWLFGSAYVFVARGFWDGVGFLFITFVCLLIFQQIENEHEKWKIRYG